MDYSAIYVKNLNFETMCSFVEKFVEGKKTQEDKVTLTFPQIRRHKGLHDPDEEYVPITTDQSEKVYQVDYDKRKIIRGSYFTVPFGYNPDQDDQDFINYFDTKKFHPS